MHLRNSQKIVIASHGICLGSINAFNSLASLLFECYSFMLIAQFVHGVCYVYSNKDQSINQAINM